MNKYNQLRINLRNSVYLASTISTQYSQFASVLNNPIVLYTNQTDQRKWNETSLLLHIETDKGAKKKSTYELEGYTEYDTDKLNEVRQLTKKYYLNSTAHLNAKGFRLFMNHTWKTSVNHVWYWETILNSSANKNNILLARNDFLYFDSTANKLNQFIYHRAIYGQISIGHIRSFKKNIIRYWIKSSVTQLLSCQYQNSLDLIITKNYLSTHLTKSLTKKINFDIQSMLGYTQMSYNKKPQNGLIYQFDQAIIWKPKATRQLSLNLGLIKQETEAKKYFAGPFYANATTQIVAPSVVIFPVMFFGQLNFSLFDLYRGVNLYAQLMIKKMNRDYFMATTVYPDYTVISQPIGERQFLSSFNMHFEKVLHVIRMKYRISFSATHLYSPAQFNGEKFMAINDVLNFGQYLSTNWQKGYNFQLEYKKINSKSIGLSNSRFKNFIHNYKAVVQLQLNSQLNGQLSIQHYNGKDVIPFNLFDMKMNWLLKSKYRIFIEGINLLHNRTFIQQTLSSSSIIVTHQHVLGRRIIFGADIPF